MPFAGHYFTPPGSVHKLPDDTVVLHGLTGGTPKLAGYAFPPFIGLPKALTKPMYAPVEEGRWGHRAIMVNRRGCADVSITSPQLYSTGYTGDLRLAMLYIRQCDPKAHLPGLGFSLGANVLTRYIAEEGESCRMYSGLAVGPAEKYRGVGPR